MKLMEGVMLNYLDFDTEYCLLSKRNIQILFDYFQNLDVHKKNTLNDVQFYHFMRHVTDLSKKEIVLSFDMLDWKASGEISFEDFYLLACILLSCEYHVEKHFMSRYSAIVFELLDVNGSGSVSREELQASGFLFNLTGHRLDRIFNEFDIPEIMSYKEFKMFAMACAEMQEETKRMPNKQTMMQVQNQMDPSASQCYASRKHNRPAERRSRGHFSYTQ